MVKKIGVIAFILLCSACSIGQKIFLKVSIDNKVSPPQSDTIYYNKKRPLTWADFKGVPDNNHAGGAVTASGFAFDAKMNMVSNKVYMDIKVYTFFCKQSSWKKPNINSSYHLLHEQHHFDITRLAAEQFVEELANSDLTADNYQKVLTAVFDKVNNKSAELQTAYDRETDHSINREAQLRWNDKIDAAIKELK
jgi:hypothetical protein